MRLLIIFILLNILILVNGQATNTYKINIYDNDPLFNPDFENANGAKSGLVQTNLVNKLPVPTSYSTTDGSGRKYINSSDSFASWFSAKAGVSLAVEYNLVLTQNSTNPNYWGFNDQTFFPIEGKGWDSPEMRAKFPLLGTYNAACEIDADKPCDKNNLKRNFHFCMQTSFYFNTDCNEVFNFVGDDDVWVFINNKLELDLGGVHGATSGNVDMSKLKNTKNCVKGQVYQFDLFYCERHTSRSTIMFQTTIPFQCSYFDYCGVCQGKGECCDVSQAPTTNKCKVYSCPAPTTPAPWSFIESNKNCDDGNKCKVWSCDTSKGCVSTPKSCDDGDRCTDDSCSPTGGCSNVKNWVQVKNSCFETVCDKLTGQKVITTDCDDLNPCTIDTCSNSTGCIHTPRVNEDPDVCYRNYKCVPGDDGTSYSWIGDKVEGCVSNDCAQLCTNRNCQTFYCDPNKNCIYEPVVLEDINACTKTTCNATDGSPIYTPHPSCVNTDICFSTTCNANGTCSKSTGLNCNDNNACTKDSCSNSQCVHTVESCDDKDPCTVDSCLPSTGCVHTPVVCEQTSKCSNYQCSSTSGKCEATPIVCPEAGFCLNSLCDENVGCIVFNKTCTSDDCSSAKCDFETGECVKKNFDPLPFSCQPIGVKVGVGAAVGIAVGGAVALGVFIYGGKKSYDYWKTSKGNLMTSSVSNPLYANNANNGDNPLYSSPTE